MKKVACLGMRSYEPIWIKLQWLSDVPGPGNKPEYKDTYLVWCYMAQMMRGGIELFARKADQAPLGSVQSGS